MHRMPQCCGRVLTATAGSGGGLDERNATVAAERIVSKISVHTGPHRVSSAVIRMIDVLHREWEFDMARPSPYARQMGSSIIKLVALFDRCAPDPDIHRDLKTVVGDHKHWVTGRTYRDIVRERMSRTEDNAKLAQYAFAESCLAAIYNASDPADPFDPVAPFWVVPNAASLARLVGVPVDAVLRSV